MPGLITVPLEDAYGCELAAVLVHADAMMALASSDVLALRQPEHPVTSLYKQVAAELMG